MMYLSECKMVLAENLYIYVVYIALSMKGVLKKFN